MIAWASTVAVVVPSPATVLVLVATSFTICAPTFSTRFFSSISLATVTPSFVMTGEPYNFSMMTLRPFGPRVTFTALASVSTPRFSAWRACWSKRICLAMVVQFIEWGKGGTIGGCVPPVKVCERVVQRQDALSFDAAEEIVLLHNQNFLAVHRDFGAGVFAEENGITLLHRHLDVMAVFNTAGADSDDGSPLRLLLGRVRNDQAALGGRLGLER